MDDLPISGLPDGGTIQPSDQVPVNRAGTTVRATGAGSVPDPVTTPVHVAVTDPNVAAFTITSPAGAYAADTYVFRVISDHGEEFSMRADEVSIWLQQVDVTLPDPVAGNAGSFTIQTSSFNPILNIYGYDAGAQCLISNGVDASYILILRSRAGPDVFLVRDDGNIDMPHLPTADPHVAGRLWNDAGTLKVSAG